MKILYYIGGLLFGILLCLFVAWVGNSFALSVMQYAGEWTRGACYSSQEVVRLKQNGCFYVSLVSNCVRPDNHPKIWIQLSCPSMR